VSPSLRTEGEAISMFFLALRDGFGRRADGQPVLANTAEIATGPQTSGDPRDDDNPIGKN